MNYPLHVEHIKSVRLIMGRNGIHLDNKEHAILEYCHLAKGGKIASILNIMLLLDVDHYEKAKAHRQNGGANAQLEDTVRFSFL
jgi:hypothetical protein